MFKLFVMLGSLNGFLAVALGAFGAHVLKDKIDETLLSVYQTGVQYQMFHSVGLLIVAALSSKLASNGLLASSGWAMFIGIILFSGSLYVMALSGIRALGAITPLGGVAFLIGWTLLFLAAFKA